MPYAFAERLYARRVTIMLKPETFFSFVEETPWKQTQTNLELPERHNLNTCRKTIMWHDQCLFIANLDLLSGVQDLLKL